MSTERWVPDDQLVPAVLSRVRPYTMASLTPPDRCWVVAGLTLAGLTAEDIAERLSCSLRLVRALRAEDMTQVALHFQRESSAFADELRLARSELRAASLAHTASDLEVQRLRKQLVRITTPPNGPTCGRGHARTPYNTYVHEPSGRTWCRECHRERQAAYRARKALSA